MRLAPTTFGAALALVAGLAPPIITAAAATPWYHVEVVVFAEGGDSSRDRNNWREEGPPALAENTVELLPGLGPVDQPAGSRRRHAFRTLPASALDLGAVVDRLDRSDDYRVFLHVAWHQPGFSNDDAPRVHLGTLRGLASEERFAGGAREDVQGTVRFWRRRFPHVDIDLAFGAIEAWRQREGRATANARPGPQAIRSDGSAPADGSAAPTERRAAEDEGPEMDTSFRPGGGEPLRVVRLTRSLRLRSGRLHYIDHPLFGVLLKVRRID